MSPTSRSTRRRRATSQRPARQGGREALVQRRGRRRGGRQLRLRPTARAACCYAPGNDPFVITVGAVDIDGTKRAERRLRRSVVGLRLHVRTASRSRSSRLRAATWSARCRRARRSRSSARTRSSAPGYIQLSGTSFAAPVDLGRRGADPGQAPDLHARSGEGRADGVGARPVPNAGSGLGRRRRAPDVRWPRGSCTRRTRTGRSTGT